MGGGDVHLYRAEGEEEAWLGALNAYSTRQFAQHARRRQHRTAGDDVSEHQGGGSEAAMNRAVGGRIFHANACNADSRCRKALEPDYFARSRRTAMSRPFNAAATSCKYRDQQNENGSSAARLDNGWRRRNL